MDLQDVIRVAVAAVRQSAEAKGIGLQMTLDPFAGTVRGDPNRLQQCVLNLLSNAIKFTHNGGRVRVGLERVNDSVEVSVADNGEGIRPDFLPYVFERFRQADSSTTRRQGGLGLGLSIVKHLVELQGGTVTAESEGPGHGATFRIVLPLMGSRVAAHETHAPPAILPEAPAVAQPSLEGTTVLAVDDEPDAQILMRRVLEGCGARVLIASSAGEALQLLRSERPNVLVTDIGMPDVDGYEFIRQVRQLKPEEGAWTPAAAITAFARPEDRTRALLAGFQTHVAKPVEPTELTAVVASLALTRQPSGR